MRNKISRRSGLKLVTAGTLIGLSAADDSSGNAKETIAGTVDTWAQTHDRVWLGSRYWANPMEDWKIVDGAAECHSRGPDRSVHSLTHQITNASKGFAISVEIEPLANQSTKFNAGFRIGIRSDINEYRSNCFVSQGLNAGIVAGKLALGPKTVPLSVAPDGKEIKLTLQTIPGNGNQITLKLEASSLSSGESLGSVMHTAAADDLVGNVAVVSNYPTGQKKENKQSEGGYRFSSWILTGDAFTISPHQEFGPILWSMYSLSDSRSKDGFVMKLSALTGPLGKGDNQSVDLLIEHGENWETAGTATLDPDAWVVTFRIPNWDQTQETKYKLVYREKHRDASETINEWTGLVRANPVGRPLRMAAMTCQNDYAFPYEPVARNVAKLDADLVYFSGDQIYENHGGFGIIREPAGPAILNYLRKFYQFGWSFRELMRDRPTICLPDDHDVFQGNIWGEGGEKMVNGDGGASSKGGYREPARMVNAVHKTNVSHHPDPFDPKPSKQEISVYFGDMVYGGVSFAIIADRQWKSGPERVKTGSGREDHVSDPNFDCSTLDQPGLVLLGERQEAFLKMWANDWRGHSLKVVLSQTVFAGIATHHGSYEGYLKADLDSGGWPQTPRDRAVEILRPSMALHINGDQHLTSLTQYGVENQRDSNWSFCTPAIAVGYPRWWRPDELEMPHDHRPQHGLPNTGEYIDGLGNKVYVYAIGNPEVDTKKHPYERAHQKGSGFGFVTFDTEKKTYQIESFRFLIDVSDGKASNQFPGWPVTIEQSENAGRNRIT